MSYFFAPELINNIKKKRKWRTYRFGNKYDHLKIGDEVIVRDNAGVLFKQKAIITNKPYTTFSELPLKIEGHEIYSGKEDQRRVLSTYYAYLGRVVKDNDPFLIIDFKLI